MELYFINPQPVTLVMPLRKKIYLIAHDSQLLRRVTASVVTVACNTAWLLKHKLMQAMRMIPVKSFQYASIDDWAKQHLSRNSEVISDVLPCFSAVVNTFPHWSPATGGGPASLEEPAFTWVSTMLGNVKNTLHGTYHAVRGEHLERYRRLLVSLHQALSARLNGRSLGLRCRPDGTLALSVRKDG